MTGASEHIIAQNFMRCLSVGTLMSVESAAEGAAAEGRRGQFLF